MIRDNGWTLVIYFHRLRETPKASVKANCRRPSYPCQLLRVEGVSGRCGLLLMGPFASKADLVCLILWMALDSKVSFVLFLAWRRSLPCQRSVFHKHISHPIPATSP